MALSLNSVTPTGHINNIIYWCAGIFNIRGLTFGHGPSRSDASSERLCNNRAEIDREKSRGQV